MLIFDERINQTQQRNIWKLNGIVRTNISLVCNIKYNKLNVYFALYFVYFEVYFNQLHLNRDVWT